jgi:AcrR family transcriptional regulator
VVQFFAVPYRPSDYTRQRKQEVRERVLEATQALLREGGYSAALIDDIAARAEVASGTVYVHFPSKADLFAEVFRLMSEREVTAMSEALAGAGPAEERLAGAVATFARRALRGRRAAYALIAEPVDVAVDRERLVFRRSYARLFAECIRAGVKARELPPQDPDFTAAALVGALGEALLGPLSDASGAQDATIVARVVSFCRRAISGREPSWQRTKSSTSRRRSRGTTRSIPTPRSSRA